MKSAQDWWKSLMLKNVRTIAVATIPDIEAIQKDAFDAGRVDAIGGALYAMRAHGMEKALNWLELKRDQITQHKDTPCSKKGESV